MHANPLDRLKLMSKKINCDVLVGSGRKYLRGPRGTGFIYINDKIREKINPMILDMKNAEIIGDKIKINKSNIFENFEFSPSLQLGFSKAIEKVNKYGINKIEQNIISKSKYFRKKLENFHQITFFENIDTLTGINTLKIKGINSLQIYTYLLSKRILCSITKSSSSLLYFKKLKVKDLLRISFHQYNSYDDINYLVKCLIDLIKKSNYINMNVEKFIRLIQVTSVLIILTGAVIGFISEINLMIEKMKVELADLLLLFIYVEVMGMIRVYLLNEEIRITYPLIIAITAISRLIIQKKDLDPSILIYESVAILIIAIAIIVLRLRYLTFLKPKRNYK